MIYTKGTYEINKKPSDFCATAFGNRKIVLVIRAVFAILCSVFLAYDVYYYPGDFGFNLEFLSYWGAYQTLMYFWSATILGIID